MTIEKPDLNQKPEEQIAEELQQKQNELAQKTPDFIATSSKPFNMDPEEGELFEWGRENVKKIEQDVESLTAQQAEIERSKKIEELRNLIHSYEQAIKAIERGEKYQVVLNKNNFDMRYDSVDKLHDQITKAEEELRMLENKKDIVQIKENTPIESPKEEQVETPEPQQEIVSSIEETPIEIPKEAPSETPTVPQDELSQAITELEEARLRMAELERKFNAKKAEKSKGFWGKVGNIFSSKEDTSPEFVNAKAAWERANEKYKNILQNNK